MTVKYVSYILQGLEIQIKQHKNVLVDITL